MKTFMTRSPGNIDFTSFCRPISDIVEIALARYTSLVSYNYRRSIGQFLTYFEDELHHQNVCMPPEWTPFATRSNRQFSAETVWDFKPPAGILMFLTPTILSGFTDHSNVKTNAIKNVLGVAYTEGVLNTSQALALGILPSEPDEEYEGWRLTNFEVNILRDSLNQAANSDDMGTRLRALRDLTAIDFALFMGLKIEEIVRLTLSSFYQEKGRWWVTINSKEGHNRKIKVHDIVYEDLNTWLDASKIGVLGDDLPQRIFMNLSRQGGTIGSSSMPTKALLQTISKRCVDVDIETEEAYDLRGTCAYNAYSRGADIRSVMEMLGHYDLAVTERYIRCLTNKADKIITAVDFVMY